MQRPSPKSEHPVWTWTNRAEYVWSLLEKFGPLIGAALVGGSIPAGQAAGASGMIYVIPMTALGVFLFLIGYRWRLKQEQAAVVAAAAAAAAKAAAHPNLIRREYTDEIVNPVAIAEPDKVIREVTFTRCHIHGPVVLCGGGGVLTNYEPYFVSGAEDSLWMELPRGSRKPDGAIGLSNCIFKQCRFHDVTFALPRDDIEKQKALLTVLFQKPTPGTQDSRTGAP